MKETWTKGKESVVITKTTDGYRLSAWQWDRGYHVRKDFHVPERELEAYKRMLRDNGFKKDRAGL